MVSVVCWKIPLVVKFRYRLHRNGMKILNDIFDGTVRGFTRATVLSARKMKILRIFFLQITAGALLAVVFTKAVVEGNK